MVSYRLGSTLGISLVCSSGCFIHGIGHPLAGTLWFPAFGQSFTPYSGWYFLRGKRFPNQKHNRRTSICLECIMYMHRTRVISCQPARMPCFLTLWYFFIFHLMWCVKNKLVNEMYILFTVWLRIGLQVQVMWGNKRPLKNN